MDIIIIIINQVRFVCNYGPTFFNTRLLCYSVIIRKGVWEESGGTNAVKKSPWKPWVGLGGSTVQKNTYDYITTGSEF